ncbi:MAG: carboxypeptidase-like regulatory domain-containing protein [Terracidiphilus sp.]
MKRLYWLWVFSIGCLLIAGCDTKKPKKPDPTKGVVTGIVICADTGKPARFAKVTLSAAPQKDEKAEQRAPLPEDETTMTDLEGRFRLEAVEPGQYYAFATLEGYLNPMRSLDFARLDKLPNGREQELDAIDQLKDHLAEVTVHVHRTSEISLRVERGAEIRGTVMFDDGTPAIGMHFQLFRKNEKKGWTDVGITIFNSWALDEMSNGHGHFSLTNLSPGEYKVCALLPLDSQITAPRICLGNTFRMKDAQTVKVQAGETASGADIEIPLSGLHTVAGSVLALADGHALKNATVQLLYADDREKMREAKTPEDGTFSFPYVPEGKYIVQVSGARDEEQKNPEQELGDHGDTTSNPSAAHSYTDKELPVSVTTDVEDIQMQLVVTPPDKPKGP